MFLSNRLTPLLMFLLACGAAPGCTWPSTGEAPAHASQIVEPPKSDVPFETKEPETFQADLITTATGTETRVRYARKGANWRLDTFAGGTPFRTIIGTEKLTHIDHRSRTYAESPSGGGPNERPSYVTDLTQTLLNQKQHAKFEKLGAEGSIERFRVTLEGSDTPWIISYDTSIKMVTRQEPESRSPGGFVFEMRGFTLDVSDDVFRTPVGHRKVAWAEFTKER